MNLYEASEVRWGRFEIEIIPFCISIYNFLTCAYGSSNVVLEFLGGVFVMFRKFVVVINVWILV